MAEVINMAKVMDVGKGGIANDIFRKNPPTEGRLARPSMRVDVSMDSMGGMGMGGEFDRKELKRCKQECSAMQDAIDNWNPEDVARRALKSLKSNLAVKMAHVEEIKARLGQSDEEETPEKKRQAKKDAEADMDDEDDIDEEDEEEPEEDEEE
jgi:hypothetical protein